MDGSEGILRERGRSDPLAIVETEEEQMFLESILKEKNLYWIGLSHAEEECLWVNGESLTYAKWSGGGPDNFTGGQTCSGDVSLSRSA